MITSRIVRRPVGVLVIAAAIFHLSCRFNLSRELSSNRDSGVLRDSTVDDTGAGDGSLNSDAEACADPSASDGGIFVGVSYFIAPDGDDANPGTTSQQPWRTWAHALGRLTPGDTLIVLDGVYGTSSGTGYIDADCSSGAVRSGTENAPITVRAQNERQPLLRGEATTNASPIHIHGCSDWILIGLRGENIDDPAVTATEAGSVVSLDSAQRITLRRMLASKPNRHAGTAAYRVRVSSDILIEECEAYLFHYHGFHIERGNRVTLRRNYANGAGYTGIPAFNSRCTSGAHRGFYIGASNTCRAENNIAEQVCQGIAITSIVGPPEDNGDNNVIEGNIAISATSYGFAVKSDCENAMPCTRGESLASNNIFVNNVAIACDTGFRINASPGTFIERCSSLNHTETGFLIEIAAENAGVDTVPITIRQSLASSTAGRQGFYLNGTRPDWKIDDCNSVGHQFTNYEPSDNRVERAQSIPAGLGTCLAYLPASSPMHTAAADGSVVGASIIWRSAVEGCAANVPLWNPNTGHFPCGAVIANVNDGSEACSTVAARLNVGAGGCDSPY